VKKTLGGLAISACLQEYIKDFAIPIDRAPQILLLTLDLHEHLVEEKRFAVASLGAPFSSLHHNRIDSRLTSIPRCANSSSISR
jgi:hypothetical protein